MTPVAIGGGTPAVRLDRLSDGGFDRAGPLEQLLDRPGKLDRLVADAGPLGRFMVGRDGELPAGTSAYTKRSVDVLAGVEAKLGLPRERALGNLTLPTPPPAGVAAQADLPPGTGGPSVAGSTIGAVRPAVAIDAGNRLDGGPAGNPAAVRA